ncbi:uncharacterized protein PFL1_04212 [Pseudozyma flocculosa PF-1]|uniref:20S-pre-rRNA D-site endonuclease NOB1 n=1 Tax=Pseudozyma flocculosa PF-1 TaxID=1277687 RepID=A0A061H8P3_9BASI|nr:uncharacterized protein PFL1_04212 [Pseudozyma flocculosa PF-1]EPQ28385.1 hypothetical protein PFL1_04212 [Pseudozyma flocculosa PF-1]
MAAAADNAPGPSDPARAPSSSSSTPTPPPPRPRIDTLILDAGALISQTPLANLATHYIMPPAVLAELKDVSARNYLASLQMRNDFDLELVQPSSESMAAVTDFARRTGDLAVLSKQDLEVLALTWMKENDKFGGWRIRKEVGGKTGQQMYDLGLTSEKPPQLADGEGKKKKKKGSKKPKQAKLAQEAAAKGDEGQADDDQFEETPEAPVEAVESSKDADAELAQQLDAKATLEQNSTQAASQQPTESSPGDGRSAQADAHIDTAPANEEEVEVVEDEFDEDDGEGEWITPTNIQYHKNVSLGLITHETKPPAPAQADGGRRPRGWETVSRPHKESSARSKSRSHHLPFGAGRAAGAKSKAKQPQHLAVACMTGDFAIQNVLLQIGLALVGINGQQISQVKSYVLRCHACMKVCKDMEKKWCPSCGNATLMRVTASVDTRDAGKGGDGLKVHLKPNFEYRKRGTVYSMPLPKPGSASGGKTSGSNLILREDQVEWQRAVALEESRKRKEERRRQRALEQGKDSLSMRYEEAWDAGEMFLYGDSAPKTGGLPAIGMGRKNPNEARRARK